MDRRRVAIWLAGLAPVLALSACSGGSAAQGRSIGQDGWSVTIPSGWHAVHFSDSEDGITSAGVQLSNVRLPKPSLVIRAPIQVSSLALPAQGIGLIIATDPDPGVPHGQLEEPPLSAPSGRYWSVGSAQAGSPYLETLWFRYHGQTFVASAKVGSGVTRKDLKAVAAIVESLH